MQNIEHDDTHVELATQLTLPGEYVFGTYSRPLCPVPSTGYVLADGRPKAIGQVREPLILSMRHGLRQSNANTAAITMIPTVPGQTKSGSCVRSTNRRHPAHYRRSLIWYCCVCIPAAPHRFRSRLNASFICACTQEPIFYEYGVDIYWAGHIHFVLRQSKDNRFDGPVRKGRTISKGTHNPRGTLHACTGNGGPPSPSKCTCQDKFPFRKHCVTCVNTPYSYT